MEYTGKIGIIGAGSIGLALGAVLSRVSRDVYFYDKTPNKVSNQRELKEIVSESSLIFICVPTWSLREVLLASTNFLELRTPWVSLSKGLEPKSLKTSDEIMREILSSSHPFGVLGGPILADELMQGLPGVGVIASNNESVYEHVAAAFSGTGFVFEYSNHVHQVAISGVLKNVYTLAVGVAVGLGWGQNRTGWLAGKCIQEMMAISLAMGYAESMPLGTAGVGDFMATAWSHSSKNREVGVELARTGVATTVSEGLVSIPILSSRLAPLNGLHLVVLESLRRISSGEESPKAAFEGLLPDKVD